MSSIDLSSVLDRLEAARQHRENTLLRIANLLAPVAYKDKLIACAEEEYVATTNKCMEELDGNRSSSSADHTAQTGLGYSGTRYD
jgi:hypothetical protein